MGYVSVEAWEGLLKLSESLLGREIPAMLRHLLGALLLLAFLILVIGTIILTAVKIKQAYQNHLRPSAYSPEQKQRSGARRRFAAYLAEEVRRRNRGEDWQDRDYAELEAEVEAEGRRRHLFRYRRRPPGVRRERSLTLALRRSSERLILVEGDPGSGKSIALRHVALDLAQRAERSKRLDSILPVFVNLKELKRPAEAPVDATLIRNHVLESLRRVHDRAIDAFIDQEFDEEISKGHWVFLFDSFDEIPDVLSAHDADASVVAYSEAVSDFLSVAGRCRGILASRHYRGPRAAGWNTFRILPLSPRRQQDLIRKAAQDHALSRRIEAELAAAGPDIQAIARNPMLLGIVCEQVSSSGQSPRNAFDLMSRYIGDRFLRDSVRVETRYSLTSEEVHRHAQAAAFAMAADRDLGLSPGRGQLERAVVARTGSSPDTVTNAMNALIYMRLARSADAREPEFTFAHRRFQEYFATQALLDGSYAVEIGQLLSDARWRETAVALLQHEDPTRSEPLLAEAQARLANAAAGLEPSLTGPDFAWVWPRGVLHILGILHAGSASDARRISPELRETVGWFVTLAFRFGDLLDAKLALQVAGPAPEPIILDGMRAALEVDSVWLEDAVYWLAARLSSANRNVTLAIARSVWRLAERGELGRLYDSIRAYIERLPVSRPLLQILRYAYWLPIVDLTAFLGLALFATRRLPPAGLTAIAVWLLMHHASRRWHLAINVRALNYSRLFISFFLILIVYDDYDDPSSDAHSFVTLGASIAAHPVYAILIFWWMLWLPTGKASILSGRSLPYPLWPLPLAAVLADAVRAAFRLRLKLRRIAENALVGVAISAPIGVVIVLGIILSHRFPAVTKILLWGGSALMIGLFLLGAVTALIEGVNSRRKYWADRRAVARLGDDHLADPGRFLAVQSGLTTREGTISLLKRLVRVDLAKRGADWTAALRHLISTDDELREVSYLPEAAFGDAAEPPGSDLGSLLANLMGTAPDKVLVEQRELVFALLERAAAAGSAAE